MNKTEFLDILRQSLNGEVSAEVIEQNINYYDQYISSKTNKSDTQVFEELGDPRLIVRTIIEKDRATKEKGRFAGESYSNHNYYAEEDDAMDDQKQKGKQSGLNFNLTWRQKLIFIFVTILLILVLVLIGRIIIGFFFAFGVPILLVLLLLYLFKKRN